MSYAWEARDLGTYDPLEGSASWKRKQTVHQAVMVNTVTMPIGHRSKRGLDRPPGASLIRYAGTGYMHEHTIW